MYVLDKSAPKEFDDFYLEELKQKIELWYLKGHKKPLTIVGGTGIGKTTAVSLFSKKHNLTLYELTPADDFSKDALNKYTRPVSKSRSIFSNKNLLFFDDIDAFQFNERAGFETIIEIAKDAKNPVIFVASNIYSNKKLSKLRDISEVISIRKPNFLITYKALKLFSEKEGIRYQESALKTIAKNSEGDLRAALLDLDNLAPKGVFDKYLDELGKRERKHDVFKTVIGLFKAKTLMEGIKIHDESEIDRDMLFNWITENLHLFYNPENLKKAYSYISYGDLNKARIYTRQNWTFLKYYIMLGIIAPTVSLHKDKFNFRVQFPSSIKRRMKGSSIFAKKKKIAEILKHILLGSKQKVINHMPYYEIIFKNKKNLFELFNRINGDDRKYLLGYLGLPESLIKEYETPSSLENNTKHQINFEIPKIKKPIEKIVEKEEPKIKIKPVEEKIKEETKQNKLSSFF
jgi:replication factor C large subunit